MALIKTKMLAVAKSTGTSSSGSSSGGGTSLVAERLLLARKLWGNAFDGTADVSGNITIPVQTGEAGTFLQIGNASQTEDVNTYIQLGDIRLVYDKTNNAIKVVKSDGTTAANLYATGGVSAYGYGSSGGGGSTLSAYTAWTQEASDSKVLSSVLAVAWKTAYDTFVQEVKNGTYGKVYGGDGSTIVLSGTTFSVKSGVFASAGHNHDTVYSKLGHTHTASQITDLSSASVKYATSAGNAGACTGNAATATKLQEKKTLWGNPFDGSGNINGNIFYAGTKATYEMIKFIDNTEDIYGNGIVIGGGGLAVIGSGESASQTVTATGATGGTETTYLTSDNDIYLLSGQQSGYVATTGMIINSSGNVGIGTTSPAYKLDVAGQARATSGFVGDLSGNAATATKLQTARTLWGQSFDGSADISGDLSDVGNISFTESGCSIGDTSTGAGTIYAMYYSSPSGVDIDITPSDGTGALVIKDGTNYIGMGTTEPEKYLDVRGHAIFGTTNSTGVEGAQITLRGCTGYNNVEIDSYYNQVRLFADGKDALSFDTETLETVAPGNVLAKGGVTAYTTSDINKKENITDVDALAKIHSLGGVYEFDYKDTHEHSVGMIAQKVEKSEFRSAVHKKDDGTLAINYLDPRFVSLALGACEQLRRENDDLRSRVEMLEALVAKMMEEKK